VPESLIDTTRHDNVGFVVHETGTNAVDAKVVGRVKDDAGNYSPWVDAPGSSASDTAISDAASFLFPDSHPFDQMKVVVKANVGSSQGDVRVYPLSRATYL